MTHSRRITAVVLVEAIAHGSGEFGLGVGF
jgi:hypothetical protein